MTLKEQMQAAQRLIRTRQYDEARAILETIEHPTARDWLQKLDEIAPAPEVETAVPTQPAPEPDLKAQMQKAQGLIRGKQYDEARAILATIDHPTAKKWLKKLEDTTPVPAIEDIPPQEEMTSVPLPEAAAYTPPQSSSQRNRMLPLLLLTLAVVLIGGLLALVLTGTLEIPGLNLAAETTSEATVAPDIASLSDATATASDIAETPDSIETGSIDASATVATLETTATANPENSVTDLPGDLPPTQISTDIPATPVPIEDATPVALAQSAGLRIPFIHELALFRVDLPEGWQCMCDGESGILQYEADTSIQVGVALATRGFDPAAYVGVPLEDVAVQELADDETLVSQTTQTANNRSVLIAVVDTADDTIEQRYYVNDNQGQVIQLMIAGTPDETAAVTDDMLLMTSTVEAEIGDAAVEFSTRLFAGSSVYNNDLNRWRFPNIPLSMDEQIQQTSHFQIDVELPSDWIFDTDFLGVPALILPDNIDASRTLIIVLNGDDTDISLEELFNEEFDNADVPVVVLTSETVTINDREVYLVTFQQSDMVETGFETTLRLVRDSDGDVLSLSTFNLTPDTEIDETIREDILFMAGNAEAEAIDYVTRLARAGLIEGVDVPDDGYLPAGAGATP